MIAAHYEEIALDQLFTGDMQLATALQPLVLVAEVTPALDEKKHRRTLVRVVAGVGRLDDVNWCLERAYNFLGKTFSDSRAEALCATVAQWSVDKQQPGRQFNWITVEERRYVSKWVQILLSDAGI